MPILKNNIIHYDLETTSANPNTTQPIEICAVAIDIRTLEVIPDSQFYSLIKPVEDKEEQEKLGLGPIEQQALDVNKKKMEDLREAPHLKEVWKSFVKYCENYDVSGKAWDKPILSGFNNKGFDDIILNRIAKHTWNYGPWDNDRQYIPLFHPVYNYDLLQMLVPWFDSTYDLSRMNMDTVCEFMNLKVEGQAHSADVDVNRQAQILCQLLKKTREFSKRMNWKKK